VACPVQSPRSVPWTVFPGRGPLKVSQAGDPWSGSSIGIPRRGPLMWPLILGRLDVGPWESFLGVRLLEGGP
jgi:hypothetical protein